MGLEQLFIGEFVGTMVLILLGDGVVAAVLLNKSKAQNSGWIVITAGWGFAVMLGVFAAQVFGSPWAAINPIVAIAFFLDGGITFTDMIAFIIAEIAGAFVGAVLVWLTYYVHWGETEDPLMKLLCFSTEPAIRNLPFNTLTEVIASFALITAVYTIFNNFYAVQNTNVGLAIGLGPFLIGAAVWGIGLSLGGPTGYAINPARDLGPRIAHQILPIPGKRDSDWVYGIVPIIGPIIGAVATYVVFYISQQAFNVPVKF